MAVGRRSGGTAPRGRATEVPLLQARALLACTRAALCAADEAELATTVCELLVESGIYAEASVALLAQVDPAALHDAFYSGSQTEYLAAPAAYWTTQASRDALSRVLKSGAPDLVPGPGGCLTVPLLVEGRVLAALAARTAAGRAFDPAEARQLQLLANDLAFALALLRKRAGELSGSRRDRRLQGTIERAGVGITRIDQNGRFVEVNQKFCEMLGYSREELIGLPTREVTVGEDYGSGAQFRQQVQLGHVGVLTGEKRYRRKDGSHLWVRRTMSPAYDEADGVLETISVVEDITEHKRVEEQVSREQILLRTIIDALPDFIYVKDKNDRMQLGNKAWRDARRLREEDVRGKTVFDIFPQPVAQRMHDQDRRVIETGEPIVDQEIPIYLRDDGQGQIERWSLTSKVPMRGDDGKVIGVVGISRDITTRRNLERERTLENAVARVLAESRSIAHTMPVLIRTICEAMGWAYGARWVWDEARGNLVRAEWWCEFESEFDAQDARYWESLYRRGAASGLMHRAWEGQRPVWFRDLGEVTGFLRMPSCRKFGFRSAFAFPILAYEEEVGVMEFFGREMRESEEVLLGISSVISNQVGQFVLRKKAEEALLENEQQLRAMFDNADVGITVTSLDMRFLRVNDKYSSIVGYTREELLTMTVSQTTLPEDLEPTKTRRDQIMRGNTPDSTHEKQLVRKDGSRVWVSVAPSLVCAADGTPRYFVTAIQDISASKEAAAALQELAHFDHLTKLPNRALFYDRLAQGLAQARRNKCVLAVLFVDLDRFKYVNDTFGHTEGDKLLIRIAERLGQCVRGEDTVGRLSGDEFAIVLNRLSSPDDAALVAKKIISALNDPFQIQGTELYVTASIGITLFPSDGDDQEMLVRNADVAMYRAKDVGRNNYQFFTPEMNRRTRDMLSMESELRRAIERDEFVVHYQPKVSLASGRVIGVEALLRWQHPERGLVSPADFIPLLEESGLIVQAGDWVLRAVCRQLQEWAAAGLRPVPVAVNLSARQFLAPDLAQGIARILQEHGIAANLVEVELTESAVMANTEEAVRTLEYLQSIGLKIAIDDFGTGYSSLSYLKRFPIRALKVDRSFVRDITTDPDDAAITQAVISMAHSLDLSVIAEGVETEAQLAFLSNCGCDEVQGYLFSRPVPGEACSLIIADEQRLTRLVDAARESAAYRLPR